MQAIVQTRYGPPEVLELREVDKPRVGDDQVLVRVFAASLHPDIWHVMTGSPYLLRVMGSGLLKPRHKIPGADMAGANRSRRQRCEQVPTRRRRIRRERAGTPVEERRRVCGVCGGR